MRSLRNYLITLAVAGAAVFLMAVDNLPGGTQNAAAIAPEKAQASVSWNEQARRERRARLIESELKKRGCK